MTTKNLMVTVINLPAQGFAQGFNGVIKPEVLKTMMKLYLDKNGKTLTEVEILTIGEFETMNRLLKKRGKILPFNEELGDDCVVPVGVIKAGTVDEFYNSFEKITWGI